MKDTYKAFDKAIKKLRDVSGELQKLLADSVASNIDVEDMTECIRNEAYELIDSCDATEDGYEYIDFDMEL